MYETLSTKIETRILTEKPDVGFKDELAQRRHPNPHDVGNVLRSNFIKDTDKIMNCPYFPRYADKTQVLSFYKNDDISHRSLHVQYVSRIARTIGKALNLNTELIESIALGHDIGHTPFGHAGEYVLDEILFKRTGRHFYHNVHSVRVLEKIFPLNVSLQTLDGILCHDGELELSEYKPKPLSGFEEFDERVEKCYTVNGYTKTLVPSTLEGCVVRISDIIAYLGKDRQDAVKTHICSEDDFSQTAIGNFNAEIINNLTVNVIENSFGKNYICIDKTHFDALKIAKLENQNKIYFNSKVKCVLDDALFPMTYRLYTKLFDDLVNKKLDSPIYTQHINYINSQHYKRTDAYGISNPDQTVIDYIASMTDDYFVDLYDKLFNDNKSITLYKGYFD